MIGNRIKFSKYHFDYETNKSIRTIHEGLVVDTYTKVTGSMSGKGEVFLGFGDSNMSGRTTSDRYYKVQITTTHRSGKIFVSYEDVDARFLQEIVSFANQSQEANEEKLQS